MLGIIGGLGPKASAYFYDMITYKTDVESDQEHLNIAILSHPTIPDRTTYILDHSKENPYPYLLNDVKILEKLGADMIAIPCNTSCYFHNQLQSNTKCIVNNMVDDTIKYCSDSGLKKVAILATDGTINSKLYQQSCDKYQIEYEIPNEDIQKQVMSVIYDDVKKGVQVDKFKWDSIINSLGTENIILGCTELSYLKKDLKLDNKFIDPLEVQVEKILNFFNKPIKK